MKNIEVFYTDHVINQTITQFFAKSLNLKLEHINKFKLDQNRIFCSYGILRGNDVAIRNSKNYIYIDHGYLKSSKRTFEQQTKINNFSGYFRIIANDLYFNKNYRNTSNSRFKDLGIELKDLNQNGSVIILSEPSMHVKEYFNLKNWTDETISLIKKYTDRKIIVHNKHSSIPLKELLKDAFAFISYQSSAGYEAIIEGVPAYFLHENLKEFGEIENIENQKLNHEVLYNVSNFQWKINEFENEEFFSYISDLATSMN